MANIIEKQGLFCYNSDRGEDMSDKQVINKISEEIICMAAMRAALNVPGVNHLCDTFADNITKKIVGKDTPYKGIKLTRDKDIIAIDVFIVADYGVKIPQLAWDIQNAVKKSVTTTTEQILNAVNIHVQGVALPKQFRSSNE